MRSIVLSMNRDTITGLRLAGFDGVFIADDQELNEHFDRAVEDPEIGIIILTEPMFEKLSEKAHALKRSGHYQLIVTIPDNTGLRDKDFLMRQIKESIGIKI